jgi:hypothetical protein
MPKNTVSDPITDQEMAFALLIMSGSMTDRQAAEAVGLNPDTAAYTKAKPRVRAYMNEHRAAVRERLVDQEADGLRKLNLGRDQILARLWELATLSHEATRGIIAGQIKALSMIVAIEGLIPDRRFSPPVTQPAAPPAEAQIHTAEWLREQQHESGGEDSGDPAAAAKTVPAAPQPAPARREVPQPKHAPEPPAEPAPKTANHSSSSNLGPNQTSPLNPFVKPEALNRVPAATGLIFDAVLDLANPIRLSIPPNRPVSGQRR